MQTKIVVSKIVKKILNAGAFLTISNDRSVVLVTNPRCRNPVSEFLCKTSRLSKLSNTPKGEKMEVQPGHIPSHMQNLPRKREKKVFNAGAFFRGSNPGRWLILRKWSASSYDNS